MSKFDGGEFSETRGTRDDGFRKVNGFTTRVHIDRQGKHIPGCKTYIPGKSVLHLSVAEAQRLIEEYAGTGEWIEPNKEVVDFHQTIGTWKTKGMPRGESTSLGTIHYSKTGCHIVPAYPIEGEENEH